MKKALTQTIIVFVAVNLITAGFAIAQNAPDEASREEAIAARKQAEVVRVEAEIAAKAAKKEAEAVRKLMQAQLSQIAEQEEMKATKEQIQAQLNQLLAEQKKLEIQIPKIEVAAPRIPLLGHSGSGSVLVVPAAELKGEDLAAITEDMTVMSRIFDKKLSEKRLATSAGSSFVGLNPFGREIGRESRTTQAIYLEGYAALFLMKVNFPISPSPEAQEEKKTEEEDTDPLWTQMRQEIYAPEEADRRRRSDDRPEEKYDAEKVEELKETLIKTLKHAANIRNLKPEESVVLTVIGKAGQPDVSAIERLYGEDYSRYIGRTRAGTGFSSPTVLTIRAKKADIDAFAKGALDFDEFRQKTQLISYPFLGRNLGGQPSRFSLPEIDSSGIRLMR